ncbi:MAG: hypothetical protein E7301_10405 [Butyrivibrio sp.]|nr:hypothetical protein [Butyrivibrio sp.]
MAYKVSYKVVAEQGEQLKKISKDLDNYINRLNQTIGRLGGDELLVNVRDDLKKFIRQLEEEKTVLNLAGQVLTEAVQSYTNAEKKTVQKVDRAKAHNRDFYKRPVVVASAGGGVAAVASGGGQATVNVNNTVINQTVTNNYIGGASDISAAGGTTGAFSGLGDLNIDASLVATAAAAGLAVGAGSAAAKEVKEKFKKDDKVKA